MEGMTISTNADGSATSIVGTKSTLGLLERALAKARAEGSAVIENDEGQVVITIARETSWRPR